MAAADGLKAVAAQLIVLHHLAFYGPMADRAWSLAPALWSFLAEEGRYAVQVFLVVGGLLAAKSLAPEGRLRTELASLPGIGQAFVQRYLRLALPAAAAIGLAVMAAAVARAWMVHPATPQAPTLPQLLANLLLLQDVLGFEALSAGLWYLAIDVQLHLLLLALLLLAAALRRRGGPEAPWWIFAGVVASLFVFNRQSTGDEFAPYHFAAFGLGALAWWWGRGPQAARFAALVGLVVLLALAQDFRIRIALAGMVAAGLWALASRQRLLGGRVPAVVEGLATTSFALFLVHYPATLLVNAAFTRWAPWSPGVQGVGVLVAWGVSLLAALAFRRAVERPVQRFRWRAAAA